MKQIIDSIIDGVSHGTMTAAEAKLAMLLAFEQYAAVEKTPELPPPLHTDAYSPLRDVYGDWSDQ